MADIRDKLILEDGFSSTLDKYVQKVEQANNASLAQRDIEAEIAEIMKQSAEKEVDAKRQAMEEKIRLMNLELQAEALRKRGAEEAAREEMIAKMDLMRVEQQAAALRQRAAEQAAEEARAEEEAAEAAQRAAERHEKFVSVLKKLGDVLTSPIRGLRNLASAAKNAVNKIAGMNSPMDGLLRRVRMTALGLFTARRMITYIQNALQRAPESMAGGIQNMTQMFKDGFDRAVLSLVNGFLPAMERLREVMNTTGGQNLLKAFSAGMELVGQGIGFLIDKVSLLVAWMGDNLNTVLIAASVLLSLYAVKMIAAGVATLIAHAPLIALIGVVFAFAMALSNTGVEAESVIGKIGAAFGWLYATVYNIVADLWNHALAPFAEAFATMLDNPVDGIMHLLVALADFALSVLGKIASGIDALFGSDLASAVNGWATSLDNWASENFGTHGSVQRMEKLDPSAVSKNWSNKASSIGSSFSLKSLEGYQLTELQDINANTGATAKKVDMAAEDLKEFVDMAEREYVMRVNLSTVTPNITVNGQNTGNTKEDGEALANRLAQVLAEMRTSSPSVPVDYMYTGAIG